MNMIGIFTIVCMYIVIDAIATLNVSRAIWPNADYPRKVALVRTAAWCTATAGGLGMLWGLTSLFMYWSSVFGG
jgi:hypothetical protein